MTVTEPRQAPAWTPGAIPVRWPPAGPLVPLKLRVPSITTVTPTAGLPVSPVPKPNDTTLFAAAGDPGRKLFLPRYRIMDRPPQQVLLAQGGQEWSLSVDFERYRAAELDIAEARDATELPHTVTVVLRMSIVSGGTVQGIRELGFPELVDVPGGVRAILRGTDSNLRDQLHLAMTDQVYGAALVVNRSARVAVPAVSSGGKVISEGNGLLAPNGTFDFDAGADTGSAGADLGYRQMGPQLPFPPQAPSGLLIPVGVAETAVLGTAAFESATARDLAALPYSRAAVGGGPGVLRPGLAFAVHTGGGNYAKVQVLRAQPGGGPVLLRWVTFTPVSGPDGAGGPNVVSTGTGVLRGTWVFDFDRGIEASEGGDAWWEQMTEVDRALVPWERGSLAMLGRTDFDAVTPWQLAALDYGLAQIPGHADARNELLPGTVFAVRTGAGNLAKAQVLEYGYNLRLRWVTTEPPAGPPPGAGLVALDYADTLRIAPEPFVFPASSPVFAGLGDAGTGLGLQRHDVAFGGRTHSYYRDLMEPWVFLYLPDEMRLARRATSPHLPAMTVQMNSGADDIEQTTVALAFEVQPHVDPARLVHARAALAALVPPTLPAGIDGPVLQALQADGRTAAMTLFLPREDGTTNTVRREQAVIDLRDGITDALTLSLAEFKPIYTALFASTDLVRGDIAVRLGESAQDVEHVGIAIRIDRTAGAPVLDATRGPGGTDVVAVTATNAVESPISVQSLGASLSRGGSTVAATLSGITPALPARLEPGATMTFTARPASPLPGAGPVELVLDLAGVTVLPDPAKVWEAVLSQFAPNEYERPITLEVFGSAFAAPAGHPDDPVIELNIDFRSADPGTVQVVPADLGTPPVAAAAKATRPVAVRMPIIDWLLNSVHLNEYQYRITAVRPSGATAGDWTTATSGVLPIQSAPPPRAAPPATKASRYVVRRGDSYWVIAERLLGDPHRSSELQALNVQHRHLHPDDVIAVPWPPGEFVYKVVPGGSFWAATKAAYGRADDALLARVVAWNGGDRARVLHPGDRVYCPLLAG
jgi:hypothetical protein